MGKQDARIGLSGFLLLSGLVLGQAALLVVLNAQVRALEETVQNLSSEVGVQHGAIDAFVKFTVDGVWIGLEEELGPSVGAGQPRAHIIEFADLECPACASVAPQLMELIDHHGDLVRLTFKNLPLTDIHPVAFAAALGGVCANRFGRFWEFSEHIYAEQSALSRFGDTFLVETARELGIDSTLFLLCLESDSARSVVDGDIQLAERLGVTSTPTFFVNGKRVEGANWQLLEAAVLWELRTERSASTKQTN